MRRADLNCLLAVAARKGSKAALERLWAINQGLVQRIVKQYPATKSVDTDDLIQCAWFGLLEAVQQFDPKRGAFTTVLVWRVRQACIVALGRRQKRIDATVSLDTPLTDDADATTLGEMIEDVTLRPAFELVEEKGIRCALLETIGQLTQEEQAVIRARYYAGLTIQRTADALSMPVTKVRLREESALKKLRRNKLLCRWYCPDGAMFSR